MASYTYDDFLSAANSSGLYNQFSQADLDLAQKYPEFGMSILNLKKDVANATTQEQKLLANAAAEELRKSYGNYTGGLDGSKYYSTGKLPNQIDDVLDQIGSFGDFTYGDAPTYTNPYQQQQEDLLNAILNREDFSWSKETDPAWSAYKKEYLREGDRATQSALASAAAMSGGMPSSYAQTAATQAGDYYAAQLSDKIPELYQAAYDRYLDEYSMMLQDLGAVNTQEQLAYNKYLDQLGQFNTDRNFAYENYLNKYNMLQSYLGNLQGQDQWEYGQYLDKLEQQQTQQQQTQELARAQIDAILAAGGTPSAELVASSGYSQEYIDALVNYYAPKTVNYGYTYSGSSGSGSSSGSAGSGNSSGGSGSSAGSGSGSGKIKSADELGTTARTLYDNMVRRFTSANAESFANSIQSALNGGRITEAEADFILSALGF